MPDGENGPEPLDHQSIRELTALMERKDAEIKVAQATRSRIRQAIKSKGVTLSNYDLAHRLHKGPRSEQEKTFGEVRELLGIFGAPVSSQITFDFDKPKPASGKAAAKAAEKEALEDARAAGLRAGRCGDAMDSSPHNASTPAGQAWIEGWHEGDSLFNAALAEQLERDEAEDLDEDDEDEGDVDDNGNPIE